MFICIVIDGSMTLQIQISLTWATLKLIVHYILYNLCQTIGFIINQYEKLFIKKSDFCFAVTDLHICYT